MRANVNAESLFAPLSKPVLKVLNALPEILKKVWPLKGRHKETLPQDIANFSRQLTYNRAELDKNYWSRSQNISAYLYYFLPWNLVRLISILPGLSLFGPNEINKDTYLLIYDSGSGPLTLPIALWLAKPNWRSLPIKILCQDKVMKPMALGLEIFRRIAEFTQQKPWEIQLATGSLFQLSDLAKKFMPRDNDEPCLITAANILNELVMPAAEQKYRQASLEEVFIQAEDDYVKEEEKFFALLHSWSPIWRYSTADTSLLFIEPGTRLGGSSIMSLRKAASYFVLFPEAPCTHGERCPLFNAHSRSSNNYQKRWCHFTFLPHVIPIWLKNLSVDSGFDKTSLSLSPLLLKACENKETNSHYNARVVSGPFTVPGVTGKCRYACAKNGLLLLEDAEGCEQGTEIEFTMPKNSRKDGKSGAWLISREDFWAKPS